MATFGPFRSDGWAFLRRALSALGSPLGRAVTPQRAARGPIGAGAPSALQHARSPPRQRRPIDNTRRARPHRPLPPVFVGRETFPKLCAAEASRLSVTGARLGKGGFRRFPSGNPDFFFPRKVTVQSQILSLNQEGVFVARPCHLLVQNFFGPNQSCRPKP